MEGPQKIRNRATIWYSNTTPGHIYMRKWNHETMILKKYLHFHACCSIIHNSQTWKQIQCWSRDKKHTYAHTYAYIYSRLLYIPYSIHLFYIYIYIHIYIYIVTISIVSSSICHEVTGPNAMILIFWMLSFNIYILFSDGWIVKNPWEIQVWSWGRENILEKGVGTHSSFLA